MRSYRRSPSVIGVSLALVVLVAGVAWGAWVSKNDPNDVSGSLDIKKSELLVPGGTVFGPGDPVKCRFVFYESAVFKKGDHVECYFDIRGDQNAEIWTSSELNGDTATVETGLYRLNNQNETVRIMDINTSVNGATLTVIVPRARLRGRSDFLRWYQHSFACDEKCFDNSPSNGSLFRFNYED